MKAFAFTQDQLIRIIAAVCADEVEKQSNAHVDFLTAASWDGETPLGEGGIGLNDETRDHCARRVAAHFGFPEKAIRHGAEDRLKDWGEQVFAGVSKKLTSFSFGAAAEKGDGLTTHSADEIYQDAAAAANVLYGRRRLLSFVAPHSLFGMTLGVITPNLQAIEAIDARALAPEALTQTLRYGDVLVATPTLWRYLMRENLAAPDNTLAVTFGEPMSAELFADMRKAGFSVMREIYGSTESGLVGWRDSPGDPFVLFEHWRREGKDLVRVGPDGEARIVEPMDYFSWENDRSFQLDGRRDGAVQIGAVNVLPSDVEHRLRDHPSIENCLVRAGQRTDGVRTLIAHIVLKRGGQPNEKTARDIDAWCRAHLRQQERPRIFHFEMTLEGI